VLVRTPAKLAPRLEDRIEVVEGDGLVPNCVAKSLEGSEVALFAIGVDAKSPEGLCTDATRLVLAGMREQGVRPLQIRKGPRLGVYRVGFDPFSGMSRISFADVAHARLSLLEGDTWLHKAPIIQY
jgi:putative NADH-flavin reductase